jgi:predicted amidohydrolase
MATLTVATCQFPVSADANANRTWITKLMRKAKRDGADVVHFCEGALSGYAPADLSNYDGYDWATLEANARQAFALAGELGVWLVVGSAHRLSGDHLPHNSVYVVNDRGELVDRYDKRFCEPGYTPGDHATAFEINGIRCATLVCLEFRYPELYRDYKRRGVDVVFHSFHAGNVTDERVAESADAIGPANLPLNAPTYPGTLMPSSMTAAAGANHVWISAANTSAPYSCWGAFFVRADGITTGRLARHRAGVLVSTVDTDIDLYDSTRVGRGNAMAGILHSGDLVSDPRSAARTEL